jgi:hypothetical protein
MSGRVRKEKRDPSLLPSQQHTHTYIYHTHTKSTHLSASSWSWASRASSMCSSMAARSSRSPIFVHIYICINKVRWGQTGQHPAHTHIYINTHIYILKKHSRVSSATCPSTVRRCSATIPSTRALSASTSSCSLDCAEAWPSAACAASFWAAASSSICFMVLVDE